MCLLLTLNSVLQKPFKILFIPIGVIKIKVKQNNSYLDTFSLAKFGNTFFYVCMLMKKSLNVEHHQFKQQIVSLSYKL